MNYKESKLILEEIRRAKRILLNCHRGPDPDAIGSSLSLYKVLQRFRKEVTIVCPSVRLYSNLNYLDDYKLIRSNVDFSKFNFDGYNLFVTLDSSSWEMVTDLKNFKKPNIKVVVIDHHKSNAKYGDINLVDDKVTSVGELLYLMYKDWNISINKSIANYLMAAVIGDTGAFRFPNSTERTFEIAAQLMKLGADKDEAVFHIYQSESYQLIKFYGEVLTRLNIDKKGKFVWFAIPYEVYKKLDKPSSARESSANLFAQIVKDTDFGFAAVEEEKGKLSISFRSRTGFNTSLIAEELGGGGHVYASGGRVEGLPYDAAVKKVLEVARKFAKENASYVK